MVILDIPHNLNPVCCTVSGLDDQYLWKTRDKMPAYYLFWASGMCHFGFVKDDSADPRRRVLFGLTTEQQYENLKMILGIGIRKTEGLAFESTLSAIKAYIDEGIPVITGPMDMYHIPYLKYFQKMHIPIHHVMITGYDDGEGEVTLYDCDRLHPKKMPYTLLEASLAMDVKGLGKRNTFYVFTWPDEIPRIPEIALRSLERKCRTMLDPFDRGIGIPAIRAVAEDLIRWEKDLSPDQLKKSVDQMLYFMDDKFQGRNFFGGRRRYLEEYLKPTAGFLDCPELLQALPYFNGSAELLNAIGWKLKNAAWDDFRKIAEDFSRCADEEEKGYLWIEDVLRKRPHAE